MKRIAILSTLLFITITGGVYIYIDNKEIEPKNIVVAIQPIGPVNNATLEEC